MRGLAKNFMDKRLNIAFLAGGDSSEREIALGSAAQTINSFKKERYNLYMIDVHCGKWTYKDNNGAEWLVDQNDFSLTVAGERITFDYAFIMIHGTPGEDGKLQAYLQMQGVPFSTGDMASSVITFDKTTCKLAAARTGVALAREVLLSRGDEWSAEDIVGRLGLPIFVKPNASGSSCGVTRVTDVSELPEAIEKAFSESSEVLIEEMISGREVACGVLITKKKEYLLPVTEVVSKNAYFDYEAKYTPGMAAEITPADLSDEIVEKLHYFTRAIYRACRCRGLARVDFIITPEGTPYMIEINTVPGMSSGSIIPKQLRAAGLDLSDILDEVIEDTL